MPESIADDEQRNERRKNLFVAAALHWCGALAPVRIRNLSPGGALIEATDLPEMGTGVELRRGGLSVAGELRWRDDGRAGLCFATPVRVADWLPAGTHNSGQRRVDDVIFEARSAPPTGIIPNAASPPDFAALAEGLTNAVEALLTDPAIAQRHPAALQAIDIAAEALARLARGQ